MNIREFAKPVSSKSLNESFAARFGQKLNLEKFTLEQLQDARNKIRTKLSQVETFESFDSVHKEDYNKSKMMLDILNAAIVEREDISEAHSAAQQAAIAIAKKKKKMHEATKMCPCCDKPASECTCSPNCKHCDCNKTKNESFVSESTEQEADLIVAAKGMVEKLTGWMEDTAEMQTETMLDLSDTIRDEMGQEASENFVQTVKPALEALYSAMETTRSALNNGVGQLTGEQPAMNPMGADDMGTDDMSNDDMSTDDMSDNDMSDDSEDEFGSSEAATGGEEGADRAKRESKMYEGKMSAAQMAHHHATEYAKHHKKGNLELAMHHKEACEECGGEIHHDDLGECWHQHAGMNGGSPYAINTVSTLGSTNETVDEASYSAKKAHAGKDIGKKGKNFSKIASKAGKEYGSKAAGERVAGAVLKKLRAKESIDPTRLASILSKKK